MKGMKNMKTSFSKSSCRCSSIEQDALDSVFQIPRAEVQQRPLPQVQQTEISPNLRFVDQQESFYRLEFQQQDVIDDEVSAVHARQLMSFVNQRDGDFPSKWDPSDCEFIRTTLLVP